MVTVFLDIVVVVEDVDGTGGQREGDECYTSVEKKRQVRDLQGEKEREEDEEVFDVLVGAHQFQ
jgi:hypothetical protein